MKQLSFNFIYKSAASRLPLLSSDEIYEKADHVLLALLNEDKRIERKPARTHGKALGEYFSMWANTPPEGGLLVLGMDDDGGFSGCTMLSANELNDREKSFSIYCPECKAESKRIPVINKDGHEDYVVLFRIYYQENKVVTDVSRNGYTRIADEKHKLTADEIREFKIDKKQIDLEQEPAILKYPDDFRDDLIDRFIKGVQDVRNLTQVHTREDILAQRRLGKIEKDAFVPNNACALLFAKDPNWLFPGCSIRFLRYEGETEEAGKKYNVIKDIWLEGCVPELIVDAAREVQSQLREFSRLGNDGNFYTAPEYPHEAWYEAIVNACVHRSYGLKNMNIFIKMFDDRLVIESPGGFPPLITPQNIYTAHSPRNPILMNAMFYLDFVKCMNEGTRRMRDTMQGMKLPNPEFEQKEEKAGNLSVRVTLRNNRNQRKVWIDSNVLEYIPHEIATTLSTEEMRIINFIGENGQIKVVEAHRLLSPTIKTWQTVKRILMKLCERGILEHIHSKKIERDANAYFRFADSQNKSNGKDAQDN